MPHLRQRVKDERGFTLIELLITILIIGVLAAIVIPSFLNQSHKAVDVSAKALAYEAQIAAETYATDHNGRYVSLTAAALQSEDATLPIVAGSGAYVSNVIGGDTSYTITTTPASGVETFTITRTGGTVTRTCAPSAGLHGGCSNGTW